MSEIRCTKKQGYILLDENERQECWDRILSDYKFLPRFAKDKYPWIIVQGPTKKFTLPECVWNEEQEHLVNSFFVKLNHSKIYAFDWQHDSFVFSPDDFDEMTKEYYDDERGYRVYFPSYYPNGDYHFFVDLNWRTGLFGHPWLGEIVVVGQELINCFDVHYKKLGISVVEQ